MCLICHDITSLDYKSTMWWIILCQINVPSATVRIILTKIDLLKQDRIEDATTNFVEGMTVLIDEEIKVEEHRYSLCETDDDKMLYRRHI